MHSLWGKLYDINLFRNYNYVIHNHFTNAEDGFLLYQIVKNCESVSMVNGVVYNYYFNELSASKRRIPESGIKSIVMFWNLLDQIFRENTDGLYKYTCRRNISAYLTLRNQGYSRDTIFKHLEIPKFKKQLRFWRLLCLFPLKDVFKIIFIYRKAFLKDSDYIFL
jgi:hypothetical protein